MKVIITAALTGITATLFFNGFVYAQPRLKRPTGNFTLKGDSLVNINARSAKKDFGVFFEGRKRGSSFNYQGGENPISRKIPWSQSIFMPYIPIFLQPATEDINGNDGLQVQLDLSNYE